MFGNMFKENGGGAVIAYAVPRVVRRRGTEAVLAATLDLDSAFDWNGLKRLSEDQGYEVSVTSESLWIFSSVVISTAEDHGVAAETFARVIFFWLRVQATVFELDDIEEVHKIFTTEETDIAQNGS